VANDEELSGRELAVRVLDRGFVDPEDLATTALRKIGRYEVEKLLGEGAAGEVYLAHDALMDRSVAIKLIKQGPSEARLRRELQVLAKLDHPGVVGIYDAGVDQGRAFFVMAYAGRETLSKEELGTDAWVNVLAQVLDACHYVHGAGVVHRDLKPDNIILDESGRPAIADFGIAKLLETDKRLTVTGALMGTPAYMAPEQLTGGDVGPWTDVYAVGAMLYERLAGRLPVEANSFMEFVAKVAKADGPPPSPREFQSSAPQWLCEVALRALAQDPQERFPSAEAMAKALRAGGAKTARDLAPAVMGLAGIALLAVLTLGLSLVGGGRTVDPDEADVTTRADPSPERSEDGPPLASPDTRPVKAEPKPVDAKPKQVDAKPKQVDASVTDWLTSTPSRNQCAKAFGELANELAAAPTREEARAFARVCWRVTLRSLKEDWAPLGTVPGLVSLSERRASTDPAILVTANAWALRWWHERDAGGETQRKLFERAGYGVAPLIERGVWEADATSASLYALAVRNNRDRPRRVSFVRRKGREVLARLKRRAPAEATLLAGLERWLSP
jgi:serine/threonine protein kinase